MKILLAVLLLAMAADARAQEASAAPALSGDDAAALALLHWLAGDKEQAGAYEPPAFCCRLARELSNANIGPRVAEFRGLRYSVTFVREALSNERICPRGAAVPPGGRVTVVPVLCEAGETLGLPSDEVLALPPQPVLAWLRPKAGEADALADYLDGVNDDKDPHKALRDARKAYLEAAFAKAARSGGARLALCRELSPRDPNCPGTLGSSTLAQFHAWAREKLGSAQ